MPRPRPISREDLEQLRDRARVTLAAFARDDVQFDPRPLLDIAERTSNITRLRALNRELRAMMAAMSREGRAELRRKLEERFGPDTDLERDRQVVERVRRQGRIRSEREYRIVQSYADFIHVDVAAEPEFLALGALLDAYMADPQLRIEH